jgi:hypothetical protein
VALLKGHKGKYRALVTDINLQGKMDGWEVAQHAREIDPEFPRGLYERSCRRRLGLQRRSAQHNVVQAICPGPASYRRLEPSQHWHADDVGGSSVFRIDSFVP